MFKKLLAAASALLIAGGLAVVAVAAPASAHHTDLSASAVCTNDGGWDVTWSVINSENFEGKVTASNNATVPVGTVLPANPNYYSNNAASVPTTYVQHVTSNAAVNLQLTVSWFKANSTPTNTKQLTFSSFPAGCGPTEATPVAPDVVTVTACNTVGSVTAKTTTGVLYATTFDSKTGDYTVTATPAANFYFKGDADQIITFTGNVGASYDCDVKPRAVWAVGECVYGTEGVAADRSVKIVFDNTASNKDVLFQLVGFPTYDTVVPAGKSITITLPDAKTVGPYTVTADGHDFVLALNACPPYTKPDPKTRSVETPKYDCAASDVTVTTITYTTDTVFDIAKLEWIEQPEVAGVPVVTHRAPMAAEVTSECGVKIETDPTASECGVVDPDTALTSWIRVAYDARVTYTLKNAVTGVVTTPTTDYTQVDAGKYIVTAVAAPGHELQPAASRVWTFFVEDETKCSPPTLPIVTPIYSTTAATCTSAATYTIGAVVPGSITWTVNGVAATDGTYKVTSAGDITLVAAPANQEDGLDPSWTNPTVLKFPASTLGCELTTLAYTGSSSAQVPLAAGMVLIGLGGLFFARRKWAESK